MPDATAEALPTFIMRDLAGQRRKLQLRLGEVAMLETLSKAGIGAIALRLVQHAFYVSDVRETLRLALEGGGATEAEATAIVLHYVDGRPLDAYVDVAADVIGAFLRGAPTDDKKKDNPPTTGKPPVDGAPPGPETSPTSTAPAA